MVVLHVRVARIMSWPAVERQVLVEASQGSRRLLSELVGGVAASSVAIAVCAPDAVAK